MHSTELPPRSAASSDSALLAAVGRSSDPVLDPHRIVAEVGGATATATRRGLRGRQRGQQQLGPDPRIRFGEQSEFQFRRQGQMERNKVGQRGQRHVVFQQFLDKGPRRGQDAQHFFGQFDRLPTARRIGWRMETAERADLGSPICAQARFRAGSVPAPTLPASSCTCPEGSSRATGLDRYKPLVRSGDGCNSRVQSRA